MRLLMMTQAIDLDHPVLGFTHSWVNAMAQQVDQLHILTRLAGRHNLAENITLHAYDSPNQPDAPWQRHLFYHRKFYELIWRKEVDALFVHMIPKWVIMAAPYAKLRNIPMVMWYTHGAISWQYRLAHKLIDHGMTASPLSYPLWEDGKVTALGHGIDTAQFSLQAKPIKVEDAPFQILTIGRLTAVKQHHILIQIIDKLVHEHGQNIHCRIVGGQSRPEDTAYHQKLITLIKTLNLENHITLTGVIPYESILAEYAAADLFINLSLSTGLDKVVLEAMACGVPSITNNNTFRPMLQTVDPQLMISLDDEEGIVDSILHIMRSTDDTRRIMNRHLRQVVIEDHDVMQLTHKLIGVIQQQLK